MSDRAEAAAGHAFAASVHGDVQSAGGHFQQAIQRYEEAMRVLHGQPTFWSYALPFKAAQIYFEQNDALAALKLGRRLPSPWGAGVRGTAYLRLHNETAADKEFAVMREEISPTDGDYAASRLVEMNRWLAAAYSGNWQQVIAGWAGVPPMLRGALSIYAGRAYLETGNSEEAERLFRFTIRAQHTWPGGSKIPSHNPLSCALAQFYLANILEREGKKTEATNLYKDFLSHFKNSRADLPQIAEARAAIQRAL
jgi:tetratricopeptide (TPR) repeat protein